MLHRALLCLFVPGIFLMGITVSAQPVCISDQSDHDGDGWGWENNQSCVIAKVKSGNVCQFAGSDADGDGWGWENGRSCAAKVINSDDDGNLCQSVNSDPDSDGWGWEFGRSCRVGVGPDVDTGGSVPVDVKFNKWTLRRVGGKGDNWCQTWAADGSVIASMSDGDWFGGSYRYHTRLYRLWGDQSSFSRQDIGGFPQFHTDADGWYGYGVISVSGTLYSMVSKTQNAAWSPGPFRGVKMLRSYDNGASWSQVDRNNNDHYLGQWDNKVQSSAFSDMFFYEEFGRSGHGRAAYPFSNVSFVQNGRDHQASKDGYVYVYSPEGSQSNKLLLARVPAGQLGKRSAWQYFSGWQGSAASWSSDINQRQANLYLPEKNSRGEHFGWYSWLPSVVWNEGLGLYIMANGGTYAGYGMSSASHDYYAKWVHAKSGSLGLWHSKTPYGPWNKFYYTDYWMPDNPGNLTYQPKLSPKWISDDGKRMTIIWSDAMRNPDGYSHSINYKWNQMDIDIVTQ